METKENNIDSSLNIASKTTDILPYKISTAVNELINYQIISIEEGSNLLKEVFELENKVFWEWFTDINELWKQIRLCINDSVNNAIWIIKNWKIIWFWICYLWWNWNRNDVEIDKQFWDLSKIAYIKTIIIDPENQGKSEWAAIITTMLDNARKAWNNQVILHAWDWSPNNSSIKFFEKHWAKTVKIYEKKWYLDSLKNWWKCSKCGNPCLCWSVEMLINL